MVEAPNPMWWQLEDRASYDVEPEAQQHIRGMRGNGLQIVLCEAFAAAFALGLAAEPGYTIERYGHVLRSHGLWLEEATAVLQVQRYVPWVTQHPCEQRCLRSRTSTVADRFRVLNQHYHAHTGYCLYKADGFCLPLAEDKAVAQNTDAQFLTHFSCAWPARAGKWYAVVRRSLAANSVHQPLP